MGYKQYTHEEKMKYHTKRMRRLEKELVENSRAVHGQDFYDKLIKSRAFVTGARFEGWTRDKISKKYALRGYYSSKNKK